MKIRLSRNHNSNVTNERTNKQTNKQTRLIIISPGGCTNKSKVKWQIVLRWSGTEQHDAIARWQLQIPRCFGYRSDIVMSDRRLKWFREVFVTSAWLLAITTQRWALEIPAVNLAAAGFGQRVSIWASSQGQTFKSMLYFYTTIAAYVALNWQLFCVC